MRKFKIFLFIEACLLTGALILMVSEHFSRFLLILFLFLLWFAITLVKREITFPFSSGNYSLLFIVMLNPFVILAIFVAVIYSLFLLYPMMNQEKSRPIWFWRGWWRLRRRKIVGLAISIIFQVTRLASLMISISFASWARTLFIWRELS